MLNCQSSGCGQLYSISGYLEYFFRLEGLAALYAGAVAQDHIVESNRSAYAAFCVTAMGTFHWDLPPRS